MIDLSSLTKAVAALERTVAASTDEARMQLLDPDQRDAIRAGVIQNFEFSYELCWKMLKRHLEQVSAHAELIDQLSFRDLIRVGAEKGLISDPKRWFEYRRQRNITSHTYDDSKAKQVYETAVAFVEDAKMLRDKLIERNDGD